MTPAPLPRPSGRRHDEEVLHRRRGFVGIVGLSGAGLLLAGCGSDDEEASTTAAPADTTTDQAPGGAEAVTLDFRDPTIGVLNYAYALEQLEAAFYTQVTENMFSKAGSEDRSVLEDLMAHEIAHREFFKEMLVKQALPDLTPDFSSVDFDDRDDVLKTASTFERLGVRAYNGAAQFIDPDGPLGLDPLVAAGQIVSVEGRHAAVIAAIISPGQSRAFAPQPYDEPLVPSKVLPMVQPFFKTMINVTNLPANA